MRSFAELCLFLPGMLVKRVMGGLLSQAESDLS